MATPVHAGRACFVIAAAVAAPSLAQQAPAAPEQPDGAISAEAQSSSSTGSSPDAKKDETQELETITVTTGTRSAKAVDKIPGAINIVTPEEIKRTLTLTDDATAVLARTVPGYAESSQAMSNTGENLRGRIALRLFDGVPQGSPLRDGTRNATFTDMGIVGRIEVINGPSASEGVGAAGGIINYLSATPTEEGSQVRLITRYSSQFEDDSSGWKVGVNFMHKEDNYDFVGGVSRIDRGMGYDADGVRLGMNTSGSTNDSVAKNIFLKGGFNFGEGGEKRLQASYSHFEINGNGDYIQVDGCRYHVTDCPNPRPNTSERGHIFGTKAEFNDFQQFNLQYSDANLFGGTFTANAYWADQAMRYPPENGDDRQDPQITPNGPDGRIWDQSEINSDKLGLRTGWTKADIFNISGLELRTGIDWVRDKADQRLALTQRLWVPPMEYTSVAPYAQLSYDIGPLTFSGGVRREDGKLNVDDYTTTWFRGRRNVNGGELEYGETLKNIGGIWRFAPGWSAFASYGEGFGLPNVGIPLRNLSCPVSPGNGCPDAPPIGVGDLFDLQPVVVDNREFGVNWQGETTYLAISRYDSRSQFGTSFAIDPATNDYTLFRAPTRIKGWELSADWNINDAWKLSGLYSHIRGKTAFWSADPAGRFGAGELNKPMGALDINPDKIGVTLRWKYSDAGEISLGSTTLLSRDLSGRDVRAYDGATYSYVEHTDGYTLVDLTTRYDFGPYGRLSLGIENLTNKQYILSWSQVPGFRNYWAGRGRLFSLTHELTW
ncbi:TonB-dependent receptor [Tahibacter soli]|uniref:TonB-dependent receptor n=1 Tax=Tahibacter soli TaxID=2983605 RepID=A0A9X4BI64_9GAMM|nr:TonB-dependent receptor [Tahibacter soli]MDC8014970.1 TonB-dependent receptor [Tahibacter soli]